MATRAFGSSRPQLVAGDLLLHEAVVGLVLVEATRSRNRDSARRWGGLVRFEAVALGVARQVQPVPRPALAVVRRGEQPVDDLLEGVRGLVGEERLDLFRRGRQAGQVERGAADQRDLVSRGSGLDILFFKLLKDKCVDWIPNPGRVLNSRYKLVGGRAAGPNTAGLCQ